MFIVQCSPSALRLHCAKTNNATKLMLPDNLKISSKNKLILLYEKCVLTFKASSTNVLSMLNWLCFFKDLMIKADGRVHTASLSGDEGLGLFRSLVN